MIFSLGYKCGWRRQVIWYNHTLKVSKDGSLLMQDVPEKMIINTFSSLAQALSS